MNRNWREIYSFIEWFGKEKRIVYLYVIIWSIFGVEKDFSKMGIACVWWGVFGEFEIFFVLVKIGWGLGLRLSL